MTASETEGHGRAQPDATRTGTGHDDLFPETERYLYAHSPLKEVICQVRFPQLLKIVSSPPAEFQEAIRGAFPLLSRGTSVGIQGVPPELVQLITGGQSEASFIFSSEDEKHQLLLTSDALSLTSRDYGRWEQFYSLFSMGLSALEALYKPSFISRSGLRFVNIINKQNLGLEDACWDELVNHALLGELALRTFQDSAIEVGRITRLNHPLGSVCLQHGFYVEGGKVNNQAYVLDSDFYTDRRQDVSSANEFIHLAHERARRVFGWAFTERLRERLGPSPCND